MFGLGKKRTLYGEFLDNHKIPQERVAEYTGLNRETVSRACNDLLYKPKKSVSNLLTAAARHFSGQAVNKDSFWG